LSDRDFGLMRPGDARVAHPAIAPVLPSGRYTDLSRCGSPSFEPDGFFASVSDIGVTAFMRVHAHKGCNPRTRSARVRLAVADA